jgi:hypothetical protein
MPRTHSIMPRREHARTVALCVALAVLWGCTAMQPPETAHSWPAFRDQFLEGYFERSPNFAVYQGRHDFDGRLPDWSPAGLSAKIDFLKTSRAAAEKFDAPQLDEAARFERDYLVHVINGDLYWLETAAWPARNPYFYASQMDPNVYVAREYAPLEQRLRAYIAYAGAVPRAVEQIQANLSTPLPRSYVAIGRTMFGGLASYIENEVPGVFAAVGDQGLQEQLARATAAAAGAMKQLDQWLGEQEASATSDYALGAASFSEMLAQTEGVALPLERVEALGREDLERNTEALRQACAKLAPGASIADCAARVQAHKPPEGPVEAARRQLGDLKQFVTDKNLVGIPGTEEARVAEAPPHMRWNAAYIDIPGPYESGLPSVYYIAPPNPAWSEQERQSYLPGEADLLFISVHEVWPGHFLQFLHSNRAASKFGQVFVGYAFAEGWAHYVEGMTWEAGLADGDPEVQVGQLLNALLRNVRYLSAIGLHTGQMTVEDSERMFREQAYQDPGNARQQAARGTFDPAYLNYTLGKLLIRKLRDDWTASRGGRRAWREFHDRFLSYGGPPVPLVRRAMLGEDGGSPL